LISQPELIMLSGGAGFIGSHTAELLLRRGYRVLIVDNLDPFYAVSRKRANLEEISRAGQVDVVVVAGGANPVYSMPPLWGAGTTAPYGHDGRSITLNEVILRHGGEAQASRDAFAALSTNDRRDLVDFLNSLVLFPPDDTASNLGPADRTASDFPQWGHGSIRLTMLFNDPNDIE